MKPKQAFGVAVRVVGLIVALIGAYFLVCGVVLIIDPEYSVKLAPAWHFFVFGVIDLLAGYCLIRGVRHIVRFAYPDDDLDQKPDA
jgi:uncharacterized membrane protein HdeD (DUF308 family)